jgi:protein-glucosylgalactosylhydroxylysine glucosidase
MAAKVALQDAIRICRTAGSPCDPKWREIAEGLVLPLQDGAVVSHDGWSPDEEKGATPDPLLGILPLGCDLPDDQLRATLDLYLGLADDYVGSPMLSALYAAWAALKGDRDLALHLLHEGYGCFIKGRFNQTLEYRADRWPDQPMAGPFFANIGGFGITLLLGFAGLRPNDGEVDTWPHRKVMLPAGWEAIEVDRLWIRDKPMRLVARHGEMARLEPVAEGA